MTIQHDGHYRAYRRQHGPALTADYDDVVSDLDMQYGCQAVLLADQEHFLGLAHHARADGRPMRRLGPVRIQPGHPACAARGAGPPGARWRGRRADGWRLGRSELADACAGPVRRPLRHDSSRGDVAGGRWARCRSGESRSRHATGAKTAAFQAALARLLRVGDDAVGPHLHQMVVGRSDRNPNGRWRLSIIRLPRRPHGLGFDPHLVICARPLGDGPKAGPGARRASGNFSS